MRLLRFGEEAMGRVIRVPRSALRTSLQIFRLTKNRRLEKIFVQQPKVRAWTNALKGEGRGYPRRAEPGL
jgi:hypothetical protein